MLFARKVLIKIVVRLATRIKNQKVLDSWDKESVNKNIPKRQFGLLGHVMR